MVSNKKTLKKNNDILCVITACLQFTKNNGKHSKFQTQEMLGKTHCTNNEVFH